MKEYILDNNLKLIYKRSESELTSICISVDAGAGIEEDILGVAHATEHILYKGTKNRNEDQINRELSDIFGFQNAMTNYPYVIYYGSLLNEDLEKALELFSDILVNPIFPIEGFGEEMEVIKQELYEWDEEVEQYLEDKLFFNCFENRRIKFPIIGTRKSLERIELEDIKKFYNDNYYPENSTIVIISSRNFKDVKNMVGKHFQNWKKRYENREIRSKKIDYGNFIQGKFVNEREGIKTCKVQMIAPINTLSDEELKNLRIFNAYFGDGVNSVLYDVLRTKNGLIYDVLAHISNENYINLYKIIFTTNKDNVNRAIKLVNECIEKIDCYKEKISDEEIKQLCKRMKLKRLFNEEKSIVEAKELAIYDIMLSDYKSYFKQNDYESKISKEDIFNVGKKVLNKLAIQIIV